MLTGKVKQVTAALTEEMTAEAEALHFERAAALRDQIAAIDVLSKNRKSLPEPCRRRISGDCIGAM